MKERDFVGMICIIFRLSSQKEIDFPSMNFIIISCDTGNAPPKKWSIKDMRTKEYYNVYCYNEAKVRYHFERGLRSHLSDIPNRFTNYDSCYLNSADLSGMSLDGFYFQNARISNCDFRGSSLYWAFMDDAIAQNSCFDKCDFRGSRLIGSVMQHSSFKEADFGIDNLGGKTRLFSCDFSGANLDGANLKGALYNEFTVFPAGFDPEIHNMEFESWMTKNASMENKGDNTGINDIKREFEKFLRNILSKPDDPSSSGEKMGRVDRDHARP